MRFSTSFTYALLISTTILLSLMLLRGCDSALISESRINKMEDDMQSLKDSIQHKDKYISQLRSERFKADSVSKTDKSLYIREKTKHLVDLKELKQLRNSLGIKIDTISKDIEDKLSKITISDSLEIMRLEDRLLTRSSNLESEVKMWSQKFDIQTQISNEWRLMAVNSTKESEIIKGRRNAWRLAAILETIVLVLIIVL